MSEAIEYEERIMLTEEQYFDIVSLLMRRHHHHAFLRIKNIYYDDDNLTLTNSHKVLRLRTTNNMNVELTLKIKGENGDIEITDLLHHHNHHELVKKNKFPNLDVLKKLNELGIPSSSLKIVGELYTKRLEIKSNDVLIVADKVEYSGIIEYNLEIEAKSKQKAKEEIDKFCDLYHLEYKDDYKSKSRRAIEAYKNKTKD